MFRIAERSAENRKTQEAARTQSKIEARRQLNLSDGLVIFYNGHFEPGDDIMLFCRTAAPVVERNNAAIVFVGDGPDLPKVKDFFAQRPSIKVYFFPRLALRPVRSVDLGIGHCCISLSG